MKFSKEAKEYFEMMDKMKSQMNRYKEYRCPECDDKRRFERDGEFWRCPECNSKIYRE